MGLIKAFQDRAGRFNHARRQIERNKGLVDVGRVVLVGDFYHSVLKPLEENPASSFARASQYNIEECGDLLKLWIATDGVHTFHVTHQMVGEDRPHHTYASLFGGDVSDIERLSSGLIQYGVAQSDYGANALKNHDRWMCREKTYPAVHLMHPLIAMDWTMSGEMEGREWMALLRGDERTVVDFWEAVNTLPDYSRFFPDRPLLPRGPGKKKPVEATAKPAFGWGAQPSI